jgi:hydroxyquinol 1,2-dioxygenase
MGYRSCTTTCGTTDSRSRARGHLFTDADGRFWFRTVRPTAYPIPTDGPVGRLLVATGRSPMRPAHVHFRIEADGYETLTAHVFVRTTRSSTRMPSSA